MSTRSELAAGPVTRRADRRGPSGARSATRIVGIDGLRGVALTLVVAYHLFGRGRVSGGVDVFLFISGVVLAISLIGAVRRGQEGAVVARWARTFARLAPPATLVLLCIVVLSFTLLPPWNREQTLVEVFSAALYVENWQLIASQLAYGAAGPSTSPVQHFWSLSIQGQILLAVPLVVALVCGIARSHRRAATRWLWALAVLGTAASFAYACVLHAADPAVAYFDTFARAWQFGAGLVIGAALVRGIRAPAWLGWLGLAAIVGCGLVVDGATAYPGPLALVPVVGAALVVLTVQHARGGPGALLASAPLAALARISYSLFLWHWPVLIAYLAVTGNVDGVLGWRGALGVLGLSVALAWTTWRFVETPVAAALAGSRTAVRVVAVVAMVGVVCLVSAAGIGLTRAAAAQPAATPTGAAAACLGAAALDPERPECADAADPTVPPIPAYENLRQDDDNRQECWASEDIWTPVMCTLGPETGYSAHLLAVGDSHNNTLLGVYEQIAEDNGWRIDVAGRPACHWTHAVRVQDSEAQFGGCAKWNRYVEDYIGATPDLDGIIVTNSSRAEYVVEDGVDAEAARVQGYVDAWATRPDVSVPIIAIRDNPIFPIAAVDCVLDLDRVAAGDCSAPRAEALREDGMAEAVERSPNAHLIDLTDYMCDPERCGLVVGGVVLSRDGSHLTATFARSLGPYLERALLPIVTATAR